jgi:hypothetical protein
VFNALDNLGILNFEMMITVDARRHVNKMCLTADVPLIESGTTGFQGQVQPIVKVAKIYGFEEVLIFRGKQNVMIVLLRRFRNLFLYVQFVRRRHNLSIVLFGQNLIYSLNFSGSMRKRFLR